MATGARAIALMGMSALFAACSASNGNGGQSQDNGPSTGGFGPGGAGSGTAGTSFGGVPSGMGGALLGGAAGGIGTAGTTNGGAGQGGTSAGTGGGVGSGGDLGAGGGVGTGGGVGAGGTGSGGAPSSGGAAGAAGACPGAPASATAAEVTALQIVNDLRQAAGAGCATMVEAANTSSMLHCAYYAANTGTCIADPHAEVSGCASFVAASFGTRMTDAGYTGQPAFEVMAFSNDPARSIAQWVNSVWHRLPILNPWVRDFGYGNATKCDTMDFGRGTPMPNTTVVVYPYAGQTGLPVSFDGSREGPMPPTPASGWPSASPVTVYAKSIVVTSHVISAVSNGTPLAHTFLTSADSNFLKDDVMMYSDAPFAAATAYRVQITGTYVGGALNLDWTFTTK